MRLVEASTHHGRTLPTENHLELRCERLTWGAPPLRELGYLDSSPSTHRADSS